MKRAGHILVVTYWSFPDALIQSYTLPYLFQIRDQLPPGSRIYLFTLTQPRHRNNAATQAQIEALKQQNIFVLSFTYHPFGLRMAIKLPCLLLYLCAFVLARRIRYLHTWCTPGGAIAYPISLITRRPLVLDSFEPHALPMLESHTWKKSSLAFKSLFTLEKRQYQKAKHVITAAPGMDKHAETVYGITRHDCFVKPACVDLHAFALSKKKNAALLKELKLENAITCVYAGKFGGLYLEEETFAFFKTAHAHFGDRFRVLLLTSHSEEEIIAYCQRAGLDRHIIVKRFVPHSEIPVYLGLADFGFCPMKPIPSRRYGTPIKNGEYWAMGLPVVITRNISIDSQTIEENQIGYVLKELNAAEYLKAAQQIEILLKDPTLPQKIRAIAEKERNFSIAERVYRAIYKP